MKEQQFLNMFENIVMVDENSLSMDTILDDLDDWDSLARASLMTELEEQLSIEFSVSDFKGVIKVEDIYNVVLNKITK